MQYSTIFSHLSTRHNAPIFYSSVYLYNLYNKLWIYLTMICMKYLPTNLTSSGILLTLLLSNLQTAFYHILVSSFVESHWLCFRRKFVMNLFSDCYFSQLNVYSRSVNVNNSVSYEVSLLTNRVLALNDWQGEGYDVTSFLSDRISFGRAICCNLNWHGLSRTSHLSWRDPIKTNQLFETLN